MFVVYYLQFILFLLTKHEKEIIMYYITKQQQMDQKKQTDLKKTSLGRCSMD